MCLPFLCREYARWRFVTWHFVHYDSSIYTRKKTQQKKSLQYNLQLCRKAFGNKTYSHRPNGCHNESEREISIGQHHNKRNAIDDWATKHTHIHMNLWTKKTTTTTTIITKIGFLICYVCKCVCVCVCILSMWLETFGNIASIESVGQV